MPSKAARTVALQQAVDGRVLQANFAAPFTGSYEVAVRIGTCTVQPCGYRVMLHAPPSTGMRQMRYAPPLQAVLRLLRAAPGPSGPGQWPRSP